MARMYVTTVHRYYYNTHMLEVCKVSGTEGVKDGVSLSMISASRYRSQGPSLVVVLISMLLSKVSHITADWWDIRKPLKIAPSRW